MNLGEDVRAIGLDLTEGADREPVRGDEGIRIWSAGLPALVGKEPWSIDFFGRTTDSVIKFCEAHAIPFRQVSNRLVVALPNGTDALDALFKRFAQESFGLRAGVRVQLPDSVLEGEISSQGLDAYQSAYANYLFCGICDFENGSLVLLSKRLWATETARRIRPQIKQLQVEVQTVS